MSDRFEPEQTGPWSPPGAPQYPAPPPGYPPPGYPPPGYPPPGYPPPGFSPYPGGPPPSAMPSGGLAGYGSRLGGWLIDWLLITVITVPILIATHTIHHTHSVVITNGVVTRQRGFNVDPGGIVLQALIVILYGSILCGSKRGQTIGMMAVGNRVVSRRDGGPIGFPRALGRAAFEYVLAIALLIPWVLDMLSPLWDKENQTWHDKVAGSVVVKR